MRDRRLRFERLWWCLLGGVATGIGLSACAAKVPPGDRALVLGDGGYVNFGDPGNAFDLLPGGERTFALWLHYTGGQYHAKILDKIVRSPAIFGFDIFVNTYSGTLGVSTSGGTAADRSGFPQIGTAGTRPLNDGAWHHVAVVQRDTLLVGYVDGRQDLEMNVAGMLARLANDGPLRLGWNGTDIIHLRGPVDELSVWDRALSRGEVRQLMYHPPAAGAKGLRAYWPMDEEGGDVVHDRGPYGINGRAVDARWVPSDRPRTRPFRETPLFYILEAALGAALLYILMRLYGLRLQRQRDRLQRQVAERTAELEQAHVETAGALAVVEAQAGRLAELDRAKNRFFGNLSHEFRSPLSLIIGPLSDLRAGRFGTLEPAIGRQVAAALRNSRRLLRLTEQLLDLARLEAGALQLEVHRIDLVALIEGLVLAFAPAAERRHVRLERTLPSGPLRVYGDLRRLETVLANLLSNALKFTPAGGRVRIVAEAGEGRIVVTVEDTGPGIPADELPRIFERFYQTEAGVRQGQGSGIGLALARELVELHGGAIQVSSTHGSGTVFTVSLRPGRDHFDGAPHVAALHDGPPPLEKAAEETGGAMGTAVAAAPTYGPDAGAEPQPGAEGDAEEADRPVVLVADDSPDIRAYVRSHLEPAYRVEEAEDGTAALARARAGPPDLIVSDLMMSGLDGVELIHALREDPELSFVPVILLTARAELESRLGGLAAGADDYLAKPFEPAELLARIANLIAQRQRLRNQLQTAAAGAPGGTIESAETAAGTGGIESGLRAAIEAHLGDEQFDVRALARAVFMDRTTLYRHMREEMGTTPSDFIREVRLTRAAELLANRENTVSEVAYAVGYGSVSSFGRRFRDRFGCAPGAYAKQAASGS